MTRKKDIPAKPRGRKSKITPAILAYLNRNKARYYEATEPSLVVQPGENVNWTIKKQTTKFLNAMTNLIMHKYGTCVNLEASLTEDPPDPDEKLGSVSPRDPSWSEEELEAFQRRWEGLRKKLQNWFANHCQKVNRNNDETTMSKLLFRLTRDATKHHKLSLLQYYQRQHYHDRISPRYEERFNALSAEYAAAKAAAEENNVECTVAPPKAVAVRTSVAQECLKDEDEQFLVQLKADWERDVQAEADEHSTLLRPPQTAEEYQQSINAIPTILQDFANAIAQMTGLVTTILLGGPIPDKGGKLEVKSIHSGLSKGLIEQPWYKADRPGFKQVSDIFQAFVNSAYTLDEQRARALPGTWKEPTTPSGSAAATPVARATALPSTSSAAIGSQQAQQPSACDDPAPGAKSTPQSVPDSVESAPAASPAPTPQSGRASSRQPVHPTPLRQSFVPSSPPPRLLSNQRARSSLGQLPLHGMQEEGELEELLLSPRPDSDYSPDENFEQQRALTPDLADNTPENELPRNKVQDASPVPEDDYEIETTSDREDDPHREWDATTNALSEFEPKLRKEYFMLVSTSPAWGQAWVSSVNMLVAIEQNSESTNVKLPTSNRPQEFDHWFKYGRPSAFIKVVPGVFGKQFSLWWQTLQPKARVQATGGLRRCELSSTEWAGLRKTGKNGFFLVLLGLAWWRASVSDGADRVAWNDVASDVLWVLEEWKDDMMKSPDLPPSSPASPSASRTSSSPPPSAAPSPPAPGATSTRRSKRKSVEGHAVAKRARRG
ncbi:hypothetical protein EIP86_010920 [Pleurotus ostreatoroseus]|nr:hypothetical protein EIP86_010920 [Pleurotus ostreatoroseus]